MTLQSSSKITAQKHRELRKQILERRDNFVRPCEGGKHIFPPCSRKS